MSVVVMLMYVYSAFRCCYCYPSYNTCCTVMNAVCGIVDLAYDSVDRASYPHGGYYMLDFSPSRRNPKVDVQG